MSEQFDEVYEVKLNKSIIGDLFWHVFGDMYSMNEKVLVKRNRKTGKIIISRLEEK